MYSRWLAVLLLLSPPQADRTAPELLQALRERVEKAKSLRVEGRSTMTTGGEILGDSAVSIRIRGRDRWVVEIKESKPLPPGERGALPAVFCDGRKVTVIGGDTVMPGLLKPEEGGDVLRGLLAVGHCTHFESYLYRDDEEAAVRPEASGIENVRDGGKERIGAVEARVLEYTIRVRHEVAKARLFLDPATLRPLRKELTSEDIRSVETYSVFAYDEELPDSEFSFQSPRRLARVRARQVARSVELYALYTGRFPRSLDELAKRPAHLEPDLFWPDGDFVLGGAVPKDPWGRPYGLRLDRGRAWVTGFGSDGKPDGTGDAEDSEIAVPPATRRGVGAPTDRLRKQFTARVQVQLLAAAVRAFRDATGELPRKKAALWENPGQPFIPGGAVPVDPWGDPYRIISDPGLVRVQVRDPKARPLAQKDLTADELRKLEETARPRLDDDERRAVGALLDRLAEDDLDAREKAESELKAWGPAILPLLEPRAKTEKDGEARLRLEAIRKAVPARRPAWMRELAILQVTVRLNEETQSDAALLTSCLSNLSQLWKMQFTYMSQFGGRMKRMPDATGREFWLALTKTQPPLIDPTVFDIFLCPASRIEAGNEPVCTYRGPAVNVAKLADGDPVGMCDDESHGEQVVILRKSGDTMAVPRGGPEHEQALEKTKP